MRNLKETRIISPNSPLSFLLHFVLLLFLLTPTFSAQNFQLTEFPLLSDKANADSFFSETEWGGKVEVVWSFENDSWNYWSPSNRQDVHDLLKGFEKINVLNRGQGYYLKLRSSAQISDGSPLGPQTITLPRFKHVLAALHLSRSYAIEELISPENISTGNPTDLAEIWSFDSTTKRWRFYSADPADPRHNSYDRLKTVQPGAALWLRSKVEGLEINFPGMKSIMIIRGTSTLVPPSPLNNPGSASRQRPSASIGIQSVTNQAGQCLYDGSDDESIGEVFLHSINGTLISSGPVYCPADAQSSLSFEVPVPASFYAQMVNEPVLGRSTVLTVRLHSGQEETGLIFEDLLQSVNSGNNVLNFDTSSLTTFTTLLAELDLEMQGGLPFGSVDLGAETQEEDPITPAEEIELIDLKQFVADVNFPLDLLHIQDIVAESLPLSEAGTLPHSWIQEIINSIDSMNDPGIDPDFRTSVRETLLTSSLDHTNRMLILISRTRSYVEWNWNFDSTRVKRLSGKNPVRMCTEEILGLPAEAITHDGTSYLIEACDLILQNMIVANSLAGDPSAKGLAAHRIEALLTDFSSDRISAILTSATNHELLTLTAKFLTFPQGILDLLENNRIATEALIEMYDLGVNTLAIAKGLDLQKGKLDSTKDAVNQKALSILESENERLKKTLFLSEDPDRVIERLGTYLASGGDPSLVNEVSWALDDKYKNGEFLDYAELFDEVRSRVYNPFDIIVGLIRESDDPLMAMKVFADASHLLSQTQIETILDTKDLKDSFYLDRTLLAQAGRDQEIYTGGAAYPLTLDGSLSLNPQGGAMLYSWDEIDEFRGNVINQITFQDNSPIAQVVLPGTPGYHYFRLTIVEISGARSAVDEVRIQALQDELPVVILSPAFQAVRPSTGVKISAAGSFSPIGGVIDSFQITQVEGPVPLTIDQNGALFSFTPDTPGDYHFIVSASETRPHTTVFGSAQAHLQVISGVTPVADAGPSLEMLLGDTHQFKNDSFSPTGVELTYFWSPNVNLSDPTVKEPVFSPQATGQYEFTITVEDSDQLVDSSKIIVVVVESFAPVVIINESETIDLAQVLSPSVQLNLNGCDSFSPDGKDLSFRWSSTTYGGNIGSLDNCQTSVSLSKDSILLPQTHHFQLTVSDGAREGAAEVSFRLIPENELPPEILLQRFPDKTVYVAGEDVDIEAWRSFSHQKKPLIFSWVGLDAASQDIARPYPSMFRSSLFDALEVSIPQIIDTTFTTQRIFNYQLTVTEINTDQSPGLASSEQVQIIASQICPTGPVISEFDPSHDFFLQGSSIEQLSISADWYARCFQSIGGAHPLSVAWDYDARFFGEDENSSLNNLVLNMDLEDLRGTPFSKEIRLSVVDELNSKSATAILTVDFLGVDDCEVTFTFPGQDQDGADIFLLIPERAYDLVGNADCSLPRTDYESGPSLVSVYRFPISIDESRNVTWFPGNDSLIFQYDKGTLAPIFDFTISETIPFIGFYGYRVEIEDQGPLSLETRLADALSPIFVDADYKQLEADAVIIKVTNDDDITTPIGATRYSTVTTSTELKFLLSAEGTINSNPTSAPIQYFWELVEGDGLTLALSSGSGIRTTATVSGIAPFVISDYTIRVTALDSSGKGASDSAEVRLSIEQENELPLITNLQVEGGNVHNKISFTYNLFDREADPSNLILEYSLDGNIFEPAPSIYSNQDAVNNVAPSEFKGLIWDAPTDLGEGVYDGLTFRLTPIDFFGREGAAAYASSSLLSVLQSPLVSSVILDRVCREESGDDVLIVQSTSFSGGCATNVADFHLLGLGESNHPYAGSFDFEWSSSSTEPYAFLQEITASGPFWEMGTEDAESRKNHSSISHGGKVYIWGGSNELGTSVFNSLKVYDPAQETWSTAHS
ncbi:hypothetical protein HOF92_14250, partial [bacterium]|nr:hypothetical protein [bacterium]